jgi:hypothetical protein
MIHIEPPTMMNKIKIAKKKDKTLSLPCSVLKVNLKKQMICMKNCKIAQENIVSIDETCEKILI